MSLAINGLRAVSIRLVSPWTGVWFAEVDVDLDPPLIVPSGPAVVTIGDTVLVGTVDPDGTSRFGEKAKVRVLAGAGGWAKRVAAQHWHNDGGVLSTAVLTATAAAVGERVVELDALARLGADFVRTAGPASRVLAGRAWYVDAKGTTFVGPRPALPADPSRVVVLAWDGAQLVATIATDDVITPGTVLVDSRFGAVTVRDVEQIFDDRGGRASAMCSTNAVSRAAAALGGFIVERAGVVWARKYAYRIVAQGPDGRLTLQAVARDAGVPDVVAIPVAPGMAGLAAKYIPGSICYVEFADGDRTRPIVTSFADGAPPLELDIDAGVVRVGGEAAIAPVLLAPAVLAQLAALASFAAAASTVLLAIPVPPTDPQKAAITTAAGAVASGAGAVINAASKKLLAV